MGGRDEWDHRLVYDEAVADFRIRIPAASGCQNDPASQSDDDLDPAVDRVLAEAVHPDLGLAFGHCVAPLAAFACEELHRNALHPDGDPTAGRDSVHTVVASAYGADSAAVH